MRSQAIAYSLIPRAEDADRARRRETKTTAKRTPSPGRLREGIRRASVGRRSSVNGDQNAGDFTFVTRMTALAVTALRRVAAADSRGFRDAQDQSLADVAVMTGAPLASRARQAGRWLGCRYASGIGEHDASGASQDCPEHLMQPEWTGGGAAKRIASIRRKRQTRRCSSRCRSARERWCAGGVFKRTRGRQTQTANCVVKVEPYAAAPAPVDSCTPQERPFARTNRPLEAPDGKALQRDETQGRCRRAREHDDASADLRKSEMTTISRRDAGRKPRGDGTQKKVEKRAPSRCARCGRRHGLPRQRSSLCARPVTPLELISTTIAREMRAFQERAAAGSHEKRCAKPTQRPTWLPEQQ